MVTTSILSEEMEKLGSRISDDLKNTLVSLDGSLKDIETGTLIKIPTDAGYVKLYKSLKQLQISLYLIDSIQEEMDLYDSEEAQVLNMSKSDKL